MTHVVVEKKTHTTHQQECPILTQVCYCLGIPVDRARSKTRKREYVWARKVYVYLRWKHEWDNRPIENRTILSDIGKPVNVDHSMVEYFKDKVIDDMFNYPEIKQLIEGIEQQLLEQKLLNNNDQVRMNFEIFKRQFVECFVFAPIDRKNWERTLYNFYSVYKSKAFTDGMGIAEWCELWFKEFSMSVHGFMLKTYAQESKVKHMVEYPPF